MKTWLYLSQRKLCNWMLASATILAALAPGEIARAQNPEGAFTISPVSAPGMVLEAIGGGTNAGTVVSINAPTGDDKQKWILVPKADNAYVVRPAYSSTLVATVDGGGGANGAAILLETETDQPNQLWKLKKHGNGSYSLIPQSSPRRALDDFNGAQTAGARQDVWDYNASDEHLQWTLKPLDGAQLPIASEIPEGTVKMFTFENSAIFPGTKRGGAIFIPAQYDGTTPACVYVQQDGYSSSVKDMMEQLIAAKDMPVTIGVFISPGKLPSPVPGSVERRNRDFEYDGMSDNYVRFLNDELLPFVAKTFNVKLSTSGNDRCIAGASSGGIAALNAAWLRPDAFSRVYASSGSFVAFRGGNEFPTLIRKTEAKPIRAYFSTGTQDMTNYAGDWFLLDQEMDKALQFSGYDYQFRIMQGGHCAGWGENFPEAMRFLWKGWPAPVVAGGSAPRVRDIIVDGQSWQLASNGYQDARGPACNSKGEVFFVDAGTNKIYRIGLDGKTDVFLSDAAHANALCFGPKDELYTVSAKTGKIISYDALGHRSVYASGITGQYITALLDGTLYVTTSGSGSKDSSEVWRLKDGKKTRVDTGLKRATGVAWRPDQWLLSVADGDSKWVYSYQIAADGGLMNKERFFSLQVADWDDDAGAESVCYAQEGRMLVGTRTGVQVCSDDGPTQAILPVPDGARVNGVALGGADKNSLFAFCGNKIWKRVVKIHGVGAFSPVTPVQPAPL